MHNRIPAGSTVRRWLLSYERAKEERREGKPFMAALQKDRHRALIVGAMRA